MGHMNLEQLTKTQLILLALLVSFVTSIATGIVTVTLVNQAPTDVIRTVNRVVEKTVERVVPGETKIVERVKEVSTPTESDLAVSAVNKSQDVVVYVKSLDGLETRGFFVSSTGIAVVDYVPGFFEDISVNVTWSGNTNTTTPTLPATVKKVSEANGLMLIALKETPKSGVPFVNLSQAIVPTIGKNVISVGYSPKIGTNVEFGKVTAIVDKDLPEGSRRFVVSPAGSYSHIGSPVIDYSARVLGMNLGPKDGYDGSLVLPLPSIDNIFGMVLGISTGPVATSTNTKAP